MDTILITGADGFFASRFILYYKDKYNIIAPGHKEMDITREEETISAVKNFNPDYVVHAAAISDTSICQRNPELSYEVNVKGSINVAKGCDASQARLIYLSSDQVYNGNIEAGPYDEECKVVPNTVYGRHKLEAENAIFETTKDSVVLRLTWMFSLPERNLKINSNIIWNVVKAALKNGRVTLPANEYRGITYVYDLIGNLDKILHLPGGIYNSGCENDLSTYETAKAILEKMGLSRRVGELLVKDTERYNDVSRDLRISNRKLESCGVSFPNTLGSAFRCIDDFLYNVTV